MNMQTGFGDGGDGMAEQYITSMTNILLPVFERGVILAAEYSKACGRDTLLPEDMEYAMKYCAMYTVGQTTGTMFPDIYQEEDSESDLMKKWRLFLMMNVLHSRDTQEMIKHFSK
jgi:hypothetical protein